MEINVAAGKRASTERTMKKRVAGVTMVKAASPGPPSLNRMRVDLIKHGA
jgi:hypothetical protein